MPKIYERNPDTGEIREREFLMYDEDGMFTTEHLQGDTMAIKEKDIIAKDMEHNSDKEPSPYRNEFAEAVEILNRIHKKIDILLDKQKEHLDRGHPIDDGK